jgi:hypothetical protein
LRKSTADGIDEQDSRFRANRLTTSKDREAINAGFFAELVSNDLDWLDNEKRVHGKRYRRMSGRHQDHD